VCSAQNFASLNTKLKDHQFSIIHLPLCSFSRSLILVPEITVCFGIRISIPVEGLKSNEGMKVEKGFKDNLALNKVVTEPAK
jgi:hypothetical protein